MPGSRRTKDDWTAIALAALAEGGVSAVAVEPLAARVGATKGSVYWHFATRDALLEATLQRWEREHTSEIIAFADGGSSPQERLSLLFTAALTPSMGVVIELALLASSGDPVVSAAIARVTDRWIAYLATQFGQLGFGRGAARRRAIVAYSVYLGQAQLMRSADVLPQSASARKAHVAEVLRVISA
ncbi:MAG: TetR/AcrR family transcriptional regulator [Actinomycetota bacterium]|nr:TetR/AcrR family transcriptional regulator [Actinomycetota bacterium]